MHENLERDCKFTLFMSCKSTSIRIYIIRYIAIYENQAITSLASKHLTA